MTFSRSHAGMIGIISLFTWLIAPISGYNWNGYPLALTSLQALAYIILFILAGSFYIVSTQNWRIFRIVSLFLVLCFVYIFLQNITHKVTSLNGSITLDDLYWWWFFVLIWISATIYTSISKKEESPDKTIIISDAIIGIVWTLTLIWLSALIIAASIWTNSPKNHNKILENTFWTGKLTHGSWITLSEAYPNIEQFNFERKNDSVSFVISTDSGSILYPGILFYPWKDIKTYQLWWNTIITTTQWLWIDNTKIDPPYSIDSTDNIFVLSKGSIIQAYTPKSIKDIRGTTPKSWTTVIAEKTETIAWIWEKDWLYYIEKEWKKISDTYKNITKLSISKSWYDTMALAETVNWEKVILKNGIIQENIRPSYQNNSWQSNWSHSIYIIEDQDKKQVIYDGVSVWQVFEEVREVFLEKSGNSYAFFARPIWENNYCLITRFKWKLCGLTGYMNPRIWADWSSIIYSGLKDGLWSIFRNTTTIVNDTGYSNSDITWDYVFFDITNPKQYLFIQKNSDGSYRLRKNGKVIPGSWKDIWLNATFGYDSKVLMTAKDDTWWRILEF